MKRFAAWMLGSVLVVGLIGCGEKQGDAVATGPEQTHAYDMFPEDQVPDAEPQPMASQQASPAPASVSPPVDSSFNFVENQYAQSPRPVESYAPPTNQHAGTTYVVRKGDTLSSISRKFYKSNRQWRRIYEANRATLTKGPDKLEVGMKLIIP